MYPQYLFEYPNIDSSFPFHMKKKRYTSVPAHRHDFIELSFVLEGKGKEWINGTEHDLLPGTIVLLLPYQIHHYQATEGEQLLMYICNFDMKLLTTGPESAWGLHELLHDPDEAMPPFIQLQGKAHEEGLQLWDRLYQEHESSQVWKPIMLRSLLLEALSQFMRSRDKQPDSPQPKRPHSRSTQGIWSVVQYVYDHYLEPLSLNTLSQEFHLHPAQLSTQLGDALGIYFVDFLHELRVRHACSLLLSSELPISQVAFESGFSSYPTFSRAFHRIKGMTPSQYKERKSLHQ